MCKSSTCAESTDNDNDDDDDDDDEFDDPTRCMLHTSLYSTPVH